MPITVPYSVLHDGSSEEFDMKGVRATMKFLVAWADRWQFAKDVAGTSKNIGTDNAQIIRNIPLQYPHNKYLYANGLSIEPAGKSGCADNLSFYDWAICTVTFGTNDFDYENAQGSNGQVYKTLSISMSAQFMTLPESPFKFYSDNTKCVLNPGMLIPQAEITLVSHQLPEINLDVIFNLVGKLNQAVFYGAPIGTVLFVGANQNRQATADGVQAWQVEYKFLYRPVDWNKFWHPKPGVGWDYLVDTSSGNKIYSYGNFANLP